MEYFSRTGNSNSPRWGWWGRHVRDWGGGGGGVLGLQFPAITTTLRGQQAGKVPWRNDQNLIVPVLRERKSCFTLHCHVCLQIPDISPALWGQSVTYNRYIYGSLGQCKAKTHHICLAIPALLWGWGVVTNDRCIRKCFTKFMISIALFK